MRKIRCKNSIGVIDLNLLGRGLGQLQARSGHGDKLGKRELEPGTTV